MPSSDSVDTDDAGDRRNDPIGEFLDSGPSTVLGASANVLVGAALVGMTTYEASLTLAVRASGRYPDGEALGALFTLVVFAVGVVFLVDGAASIFAEKQSSE
ncbi:hypothetical protein SAMN04487950_2902 [Halogranum rubrum]|uniref:Uncharacterized protein n=1 Tax=Halogranum rubrum TaxID=553466 RepID=A0A1I4FX67_9EURY|nr:hypothetical protein [Halogranum rubrum]SFL22492.1 hypothetical protein SAMN04487950_2902 [Halogranum rubrum]